MRETVGFADSEPGAGAGAGFVLGGRGCGGHESLGNVYCSSPHQYRGVRNGRWKVCTGLVNEGEATYRDPHLVCFWVEDMVCLVLCRLVVERGEELFGEL